MRLENLVEAVSEVFLPSLCLHCGESLSGASQGLCEACWSRMVPLSSPTCALCGGLCDEPGSVCLDCHGSPPPQAATVVWGEYGGPLRAAVLALKHRGRDELAGPLAERMLQSLSCWPWLGAVDTVTWVPSHAVHTLRRGWSAARLLARRLALDLGSPVCGTLCRRGLGRQARRSRAQRLRLPSSSFVVRRKARDRSARRVLLVDDVVTTGATLRRAAAALLKGGSAAVHCVVLARTPDPRRLP